MTFTPTDLERDLDQPLKALITANKEALADAYHAGFKKGRELQSIGSVNGFKLVVMPEKIEYTNTRGRCFIEFQLVDGTTAVVLVYLINDDYSTSDTIYDSYKGDVIGAMDKYFQYAHLDSAILDAE